MLGNLWMKHTFLVKTWPEERACSNVEVTFRERDGKMSAYS